MKSLSCLVPLLLSLGLVWSSGADAQEAIRVADELRVNYESPAFQPTAGSSKTSRIAWSQELHMPGASFITPHFSHFDLPARARVVVRSPDHSRSWTFTGYGKSDHLMAEGFWGIHIYGDTAVVELISKVPVPEGAVVIDAFTHGYPDARWPDAGLAEGKSSRSSPSELFRQDPWWQLVNGGEKAICGADDSDWARCYQSSEPAIYSESRAVARLLINGSGACTGWLVGSAGHLMTNEHCITTSSDAGNTNYEFLAEGSCSTDCSSWGACPGTVVATSASLVKDDATLDYALVQLPTNPTGTYGFMQLRESGAVVDERIYIPQHPAHWGKKIGVTSGASSDQSGYCEVYSLSSAPCSGGSGNDVGYFCDTQGGSSGSPVLGYDDHLVVALHHCANCPNRGVPIQSVISDLQATGDLPPDALGGGGGGDGDCDGNNCIDWDATATTSFANQDSDSNFQVQDGGDTMYLQDNTWRRTNQTFEVTANTVVEFDFSSSSQGEIHGIGFDEDDTLSSNRIFKVHGSQSYGIQDFDNYAGGTVTYTIPVGQYFTGSAMYLVLVNDNDAGSGNNSTFSNVRVYEDTGGSGSCDGSNCIDWDVTATTSFATQDSDSNFQVQDGGDTLYLQDNTWRRTTGTFTVTANTVVEFDFSSNSQGEIHGIGFDEDDTLSSNRIFKVHGSQSYGIQDFDNYGGGTVAYSIPVGQYFTGSAMYLVLVNDNDAGSGNDSSFSNVRVYESGGGGGVCAVDDDFEGGAAGWSNDAASTCSTGSYVLGDPTQQTSTVVTQPAGSASGVNSIFTATNTSAGSDDVDGGNCILSSPSYSVGATSTLAVNYFHGQRDAGDDASGDFFRLEYRVDGGSWQTVVSNGDSTSTAAWTNATATVPAGSVEVRVQCSDGSGAGDIVECGIDDLSICEN